MQQPSFDFGPIDDGGNPTYSVSELSEAINAQLRRGFYDGVWVRGEIDGLRHSGPHTYFSLVEHTDDGKAVVNVSLFAPTKRRLTPLLKKNRLELANGLLVRINGHLDYYAPNGRLGFKMAGLDPTFTLGELSQARDQVVRRLVASGMFDANRRTRLSPIPLRVGVVTSVGTAAWHDFHNELLASGIGFEVAVADVRVQGPSAIASIAAALRTLSRSDEVDVIVLIRGGGARTDLAVFDAEAIAIAIATSRIPVMTGLGHEIDRSIADEVAHTAVKTPTAVARHLIDLVNDYRDRAEQSFAAVLANADRHLRQATERIGGRSRRVHHLTHTSVDRAAERLNARSERVVAAPRRLLDAERRSLNENAHRLVAVSPRLLRDAERVIDAIAARVATADPVNLMNRGWSITRRADTGVALASAAEVAIDTVLTTHFADGTVTSTVTASAAMPAGKDQP